MENNKTVRVTNRNNGTTGYVIREKGINRNFAPKETKEIEISELKSLSYTPGGEYILKNLLIVNDQDALDALTIHVEPEYFYTEEEINQILTIGSIDQLKDFLDFAPEGGIELLKDMAVKMELPDTRKRETIELATGFSVNNAIMVNKVMNEPVAEQKDSGEKTRRTAPVTKAETTPTRRTTPKYKVTSTQK